MSEYEEWVTKTSLKLKRTDGMVTKSKKKKSKKLKTLTGDEKLKYQQMIEKSMDNNNPKESNSKTSGTTTTAGGSGSSTSGSSSSGNWMTAAERKFLDQQTRRQTDRIMTKAAKSHKQRVEEFNTNLENLSEHYDIPKVSWTK